MRIPAMLMALALSIGAPGAAAADRVTPAGAQEAPGKAGGPGSSELRLGTGAVKITPPVGAPMAG